MKLKRDVRPITQLKNRTADIVREVEEIGRTLVITQNGEAKAVVMGIETFDRWREALALLKILARAEADVDAGHILSGREAFARAAMAAGGPRRRQAPEQ